MFAFVVLRDVTLIFMMLPGKVMSIQ